MQIGRAEPQPIQRHVRVAECLPEMREALLRIIRLGIQEILIDGQIVGVRIQPVRIGIDLLNRRDLPDFLALKVPSVYPMATGAILLVDQTRLSPRGSD